MGSKEKILKNKLFWASAAIASSLLFSQLVLGHQSVYLLTLMRAQARSQHKTKQRLSMI